MRLIAAIASTTALVLMLAACGPDPASELAARREKAEIAQLSQVKTVLSTPGALDTDFEVFLV